jgi:hypothetical protein
LQLLIAVAERAADLDCDARQALADLDRLRLYDPPPVDVTRFELVDSKEVADV